MSSPTDTADPNQTKVIIVGIGIGGLSAAIECQHKGYKVTVFDRITQVEKKKGDVIGIAQNGARVMATWGNGEFFERTRDLRYQSDGGVIFDSTGRHVVTSTMPGYRPDEGFVFNRGACVSAMYDYAVSIGVDVRLGAEVTGYWEGECEAGVIVQGERMAADCVVCAEGINSRAMIAITGYDFEERSTGISIIRGNLDAGLLVGDPDLAWVLELSGADKGYMWHSGTAQFSIWCKMGCTPELFWYGAYKDEECKDPNPVGPILEAIKDWPVKNQLEPIIHKAPTQRIIRQKLTHREPLKTWLSPGCRIIVTGDAAHVPVPAGGQGGSQAIEDAAVLAICLELAGKENIPLALQVTEKIRYRRATEVQKRSREMLEKSHSMSLEQMRRGEIPFLYLIPYWFYGHDCQSYTYKEFPIVVEAIQSGREYLPRNFAVDDSIHID
ncbi:FAD/NAD(P)-binding domain-containing protein [Aspergillus avenaceus]|uniref:FAD/NAD(P)-binding domain-containing protein n=1 Tax=Aspergillus avenaceus TaxID=36643 RepID=A0A5N6TQ71_ASPAV|nr:FAD/NAD(P)-binding domain-containing protein [Aspergillus avenaceus]